MIRQIRNERVNAGINNSKKVNAQVYIKLEDDKKIFSLCEDCIKRLGYLDNIVYLESEDDADKNYTIINLPKLSIYIDLFGSIDIEKEKNKLNEERNKIISELNRAKSMLANEKFVCKAPEKLVNAEKEKLVKYQEMLQDIDKKINSLR